MNDLCGASLAAAGDYRKGWALRSGDFARLCNKCGTAYEQLAFCELFHLEDTGWRECTSCGKRLHCGCIASTAAIELLENGGVSCASCSNSLRRDPSTSEDKLGECGISVENSIGEIPSSSNKMLKQSNDDGQKYPLPSDNDDTSTSQMKQEEIFPISTFEPAHGTKSFKYRETTGGKDVIGSLVQTDLTMGLASSSSSSQKSPFLLPLDGRELNKPFQQGPRLAIFYPKCPNPSFHKDLMQILE